MLARFVLGFLLVFSAVVAQAQNDDEYQPQLPGLEHADDILVDTWLGSPNKRLAKAGEVPQVVLDTLSGIEVAFEMGDGYYNHLADAIYVVTNPSNPKEIVGYMSITLMSYTEDPEYYVATLYVNPQGRLLNEDWVTEATPYQKEEIEADFPPELQIPAEEE